MPLAFLPSSITSLGHLMLTSAGGAYPSSRSAAASAATKVSCAASAGGRCTTVSRVAARLPVSLDQVRPRRPRPADWRRATIHSGPVSPRSAMRRASALVESVSSRIRRGAASANQPAPKLVAALRASGSSQVRAISTSGNEKAAAAQPIHWASRGDGSTVPSPSGGASNHITLMMRR